MQLLGANNELVSNALNNWRKMARVLKKYTWYTAMISAVREA
jgi:hypothetical protein